MRNKTSGEFFRTGKLHTLNHRGVLLGTGAAEHRPHAAGRPILFRAGASEDGKRLAAQHADAIFTHHDTLEQAQDFYQDVKRQLVEQGREPDDLRIFRGVSVIVGDDDADVERQYRETARPVSIENALNYLGRYFEHYDFARHPLDAPFPDIGDLGQNSFRSTTDAIKRSARERNLTLRRGAGSRLAAPGVQRHAGSGGGRSAALVRRQRRRRFHHQRRYAQRLRPLRRSGGARPATAWPVPPGVPRRHAARAPGLKRPLNRFTQ